MLGFVKAIFLIGTANMAIGLVCIYKESIDKGVYFDLLGNPSNFTTGCECPPPDDNVCSPNEKVELSKLQHYVPWSHPDLVECCYTFKNGETPENDDNFITTQTFNAVEIDPDTKVVCNYETSQKFTDVPLRRGFTLKDAEEGTAWECDCFHFRVNDFWLCYNQECGHECQAKSYDRLSSLTEECCID